MKITLLLITLTATLFTAGCAGPTARHDTRVDRRYDTADRALASGRLQATQAEPLLGVLQ